MDDQPTQAPRQRWTGGPDRTRISRYQPRPNVEDNKEKSEYVFKHHDARRADAERREESIRQPEPAAVNDAEKRFEKRNRTTKSTFIAMLIVAIVFDVAGALAESVDLLAPPLGWILSCLVDLVAWLTFYIWTSVKGWGLSDSVKQFLLNQVIPITKLIPGLNLLPTWTLKVVLTYGFLKTEDLLYNQTGGKADFEKLEEVYQRIA
jgi:hypothetical protein